MGRQVAFHMFPQDCQAFLTFVQERNDVLLTEFTADTASLSLSGPKGLLRKMAVPVEQAAATQPRSQARSGGQPRAPSRRFLARAPIQRPSSD